MADKLMRSSSEPAPSPALSAHPLMTLRSEVDRLFDSFFPPAFGRSLFDCGGFDPARDSFFGSSQAFAAMGELTPCVDVKECGDHYEIAAELPGLDERDVAVTVRDGLLSITGEKRVEGRQDKESVQMSERSYGAFTRTFRLPDDVNLDAIGADFAKGVLTVTIAKRPRMGKGEKKIEIKAH